MSLNPQALASGHEQYEFFEVEHLARRGKDATRVQYDYRHTDGKLFSCVARTLEDARVKRDQWRGKKLDFLTEELTAFASFAQMLDAEGGYRPSFYVEYDPRFRELADAYDKAQEERGDPRRAYRGGKW